MFDIGFGELVLVFVIGLVVLGPERLPVAVRTVAGWIKAVRSLASTVQNELTQELKLQELQDSLKKVEEASKNNLSPELKSSMDELREAAESMKKSFKGVTGHPDEDQQHNTIHNPLVTDPEAYHDGVTPAEGAHHAEAPPMAPVAQPQAALITPADEAHLQAAANASSVSDTANVAPGSPASASTAPAAVMPPVGGDVPKTRSDATTSSFPLANGSEPQPADRQPVTSNPKQNNDR